MPQFTSTPEFFRISRNHGLCEYLLLIVAEDPADPDHHWTAGTAFLIGDRLALSASHIFSAFQKKFNETEATRRSRLQHLPPESASGHAEASANCGFEAIQFRPDGTVLRWNLRLIRTIAEYSADVFDSDLCLLVLEPHVNSPAAQAYTMPKTQLPRLQLFPPAVGAPVVLCGWPDHPNNPNGELPGPMLNADDFFFMSIGNVEHLSTTIQSKEKRNAPHIRSDIRSEIGMSGGPIFTFKQGLGWVICGSHMAGEPLLNISRHSILWPVLLFDLDHPRLGACSMGDVMRMGEVNAPCCKFFELERIGNFRRVKCSIPELKQAGTILGSADWIIGESTSNLIEPISPLIKRPSLWLPPQSSISQKPAT